MGILTVLLLGVVPYSTAHAVEDLVWLEAEQLNEHGGWAVDAVQLPPVEK